MQTANLLIATLLLIAGIIVIYLGSSLRKSNTQPALTAFSNASAGWELRLRCGRP